MSAALRAVVSLFFAIGVVWGQRSDDVSSMARRQDGVFFGLGGLDAHSMPFDLDAFFEHAAPTRTTRSGAPSSTKRPTPKPTLTTPRPLQVATARSSAGSDGGHFDSFTERRVLPVTSSRFLLPSVPQRSARPIFQQGTQQRAPAFQTAAIFVPSNEGQRFRGQTHNVESLQQRFAPQSPPTRQQLLIERPAFKPEFQQNSQPIRRPVPSSFRDVRPETAPIRADTVQDVIPRNPTQQVNNISPRLPPFRPSLSSHTVQRFPAISDTARQAPFPDDSPFDNRQRFTNNRRPNTEDEAPRFHGQSPAPAPPRQSPTVHRQEQSSPDSLQEFDDPRPFSPEEDQQSFPPEEDQFSSRPIDSSEGPTRQFFSSQEANSQRAQQASQETSRPAPNSHFDFGTDVSTDNLQHPEEDIFDGPSQDPPPQNVDEQQDGEFSDEPDFFVPESQEGSRRPFQAHDEVLQDDPRPTSQFASQEHQGNGPTRSPSIQEEEPNNFAEPPSTQNVFEAPQPVSSRPISLQRPTAAPQPSLSHRGISGVVPSPQLTKPDPLRHIPQTQADDGNRQQSDTRFTVPVPQRPSPQRLPTHGITGSNFNFQAPARPTDPNTQRPRFSDSQIPIRNDQHHFRQMQSTFNPPQRPQLPVTQAGQSFQNDNSDDGLQEQVFTRTPSHHTKPGVLGSARGPSGVTTQFFQGNDELTGQLSPSFIRATEPTNFETETERPANLRFSLSGGHPSGPSTQFETTRDRSFSRAQVQQQQQKQQQQLQQQQQQQQQRTTTFRRRPFPKPEAPSTSNQNSAQSDFDFNSPQSTIDVSTQFQLPRSKFSTSNDDDFSFNRRPSALRTDSDDKLKSHKRLPVTQSASRTVTANRGSKRGPVLAGRTSAAQFATENSINDINLQDTLSTRTRGGHTSGLDSRLSSSPPVAGQPATACNPSLCHLPKCFCGGNQISPGNLHPEEIPQIVVLTFDDAVNDLNWALYTRLFFKDRKNPNGCPILSTFYVSHEWTDYAKVQNLYAAGHEIASHSISHGDGRDYSKKKWYNEIYGQREILSAYANVKLNDVQGMRTPFLAMGGDKQFSMLYETNFTYESSMTVTDVHPPFWPYTLDYAVPHRCAIPPCPKLSYPGFWEIPMVALTDLNGGKCSMADSCSFATTEEGIYEMLMKNFERHYNSNRSPFGLYYHASWFLVPHRQEGFVKFLEEILQKDDVYFVTALQMLEWVKNPTPLSKIKHFEPWRCDRNDRVSSCNRHKSCELRFKGDVRYMSTCNSCPNVYPWVGDTGVTKHVHTISS